MMYAGLGGRRRWRSACSSPRRSTSAPRRSAYEPGTAAGKESKTFIWKDRSPAAPAHRVRRPRSAGLVLSYMGLKRRGKTSPNFLIGSDARRRRAGLAGLRAVVVAPAGRRDRRRLRRQRHPAHDRRGVRRQPELPAAAVHPAARLQLLAAAGRLGAPRLRRDDLRRHRDAAARARSTCRSSPGAGTSRSTRSARRSRSACSC